MNVNDKYTLEVFDISTSGEGIGRADGVVTFVPGLIPGDIAEVEIKEVKKNIARGKALEIQTVSNDRVEPPCPYAQKCGGCTLQSMDYTAQLRLKEKQLRDKLDRIYGGQYPEPEAIVGMDQPWNYRNKAMYAVYAGNAKLQKDGSVKNSERPRVGFYDGKGRNIVECTECHVQADPAVKAAEGLRQYIKETGITVYDEKTRKGKLRQLMVRSGFNSREVMVMLVMNGKKLPKPELLADIMFNRIDELNDGVAQRLDAAAVEEGFGGIYTISEEAACAGTMGGNCDCFRGIRGLSIADIEEYGIPEAIIEMDEQILDRMEYQESWYELKSLVINHNQNPRITDISTDIDVIYGNKVITDWITIGKNVPGQEEREVTFEISPFSFYQVNPVQMEKLYDTVLEFADLKGHEMVFDLYCGVGTIGLCCAPKARYVWGIEAVKNAVIDANRNAVINGIVNIRFMTGKAEEKIIPLMDQVREENGIDDQGAQLADLVIVDPPRAGCKPELLTAIMEAGPEKIIYVSCDPGTLARDLKLLTGGAEAEAGGEGAAPAAYRIERIRQVDQFCHSTHVESVCLLSKVNTQDGSTR